MFGAVTTGKSTRVTDIARTLRADSSHAEAKRVEEEAFGIVVRAGARPSLHGGFGFTTRGNEISDAKGATNQQQQQQKLKFSVEDTHGEVVERTVTPESGTATEIVLPDAWDTGVAIPDQGDVTFTATTDGGSAQIHGTYHT